MNRTVSVFIGLELSPATGEWVEVDPDSDVTDGAVQAVRDRLAEKFGPDRESGVMDTNDYPGRSSDLVTIQAVVTAADHSGQDVDAVIAFLDYTGASYDDGYDLASAFTDAFAGVWEDESAYAREFAESTDEIPEKWVNYIDWDAYARDIFYDLHSAPCPSGGIYVFHTN